MFKILVIDDAILTRQFIKKIIEDSFVEVEVHTAPDGFIGLEKIKLYKPDIVTLDYEMPRMNGIECLKEIIKFTDIPVIMISSFTAEGTKQTIEALNIGAFDFICKPTNKNENEDFSQILVNKVKDALSVRGENRKKESEQILHKINRSESENEIKIKKENKVFINTLENKKIDIIGIGISTGGPPVITKILSSLPENFKKPILIVQHMPVGFTEEFARRLNEVSKLKVKEAQDNEKIAPGTVYVAKGGMHMEVDWNHNDSYIRVFNAEKVSGHKPSADVLFYSIAKHYGENALGIIMTGMGADGSKGMLEMRKAGAYTIGQNEESCIVYGMPKVANEIGGVIEELNINTIIQRIISIK